MAVTDKKSQRVFTCAVCGNFFRSLQASDESCREEFIARYGHTPEETVGDELVSVCDTCNEKLVRTKLEQ